MANERGNSEIATTFAFYGGIARKIQDASYVGNTPNPNALRMPSRGQADYVAILPRGEHGNALGLAIEAKADRGSEHIAFSAIEPDQRDWLDRHTLISWLWLWMGAGRPPLGRTAYLIPWALWEHLRLDVEQTYGLKGLAWRNPHQLEHRQLGLSIHDRMQQHELQWQSGHWLFPEGHIIWSR
jgi:hypothetical protein